MASQTTITRRILILGLSSVVIGTTAGCGLVQSLFPQSDPTPTTPPSGPVTSSTVMPATPPSTPQSAAPTTAPAPSAPPPPPTMAPSGSERSGSAPAPSASIDEATAERTVRDLFDAIEQEQFDRIRSLTTGQARGQADALITRLQDAERQANVKVDLVVTRMTVTERRPDPPGVRVGTEFSIDARVGVGPFAVTAESISGAATFYVRNEGGRAVIEEISGDLR